MTLWDTLTSEWQENLLPVMETINGIDDELALRRQSGLLIAPGPEVIFRALGLKPQEVNVVIIGQDPYPANSHATGLAFDVPAGTLPLPPTLRNILKEVHSDVGSAQSEDGDLSLWHQQGVLLLNRVLTVEVGNSMSHHGLGWQHVTRKIVETVVKKNPQVISVLWGKQAQELADLFHPKWSIASAHPSPLSAYRGFFGSEPFSKINVMLTAQGRPTIRW
jgi:uracil-DNA glycosylase